MTESSWRHIALLLLVIAFTATSLYFFGIRPPKAFPTFTLITIPEGMTLSEASDYLEAHQVLRSSALFRTVVTLMGGEEKIQAGDYFIERPLSVFEVAGRVMQGDYGLLPIKVRIPEGATSYQIASILERAIPTFRKDEFIELAAAKEGFLFPDTYFFLPNTSPAQIVDIMERNFYRRISVLEDRIAMFGVPLTEVITMASLLEKEARWLDERRIIAGILWNRIKIDMPLQVDAVFGYINSTSTFHPKFSDLKVESPYNTYRNKGLPPGPIASPSLISIEAAVTPKENDYLFYLTGRDGKMYYSETFAEHVTKKYRYLK